MSGWLCSLALEAAEGILRGISPRSHKRISKLRQLASASHASHLLRRGAVARLRSCLTQPGLPHTALMPGCVHCLFVSFEFCRSILKPCVLGWSASFPPPSLMFCYLFIFLSLLRKGKWILLTQMELVSFSGVEEDKANQQGGYVCTAHALQSTPAWSA